MTRSDDRKRTVYRREYPLGRIVGQSGRRQRERSETLKIDSMKRPFDVVLMQDISQSKEQSIIKPSDANHQTNKGAAMGIDLLKSAETPNQDEVNESIDAMQPETGVIDLKQFQRLSRQLSNGYNTGQLSGYLKKSRNLPNSDRHSKSLEDRALSPELHNTQIAAWRPGRTPFDEKHGTSSSPKKNVLGSKKKRLIDKILSHAWGLAIASEDQQIGELDMTLQSWQIQHLFDIPISNRPNYEHVVQPQILLHNSEIVVNRSHNVVRIAARQRDAEEIAGLLKQELRKLEMLKLDLSVFKPFLERTLTFRKAITDADLKFVAQHTSCAIELANGKKDAEAVYIYGRSRLTMQHAKRLLISLLDLSSPTSTEVLDLEGKLKDDRQDLGQKKNTYLPNATGPSLHFRYRSLPLVRYTTATSKSTSVLRAIANPVPASHIQKDPSLSTAAAYIVPELATMKPFLSNRKPGHLGASYWEALSSSNSQEWEVRLCKLLHVSKDAENAQADLRSERSGRKELKDLSVNAIIQPQIPGADTLLSYFRPINQSGFAFDGSPSGSYLAGHFIPSPSQGGTVEIMQNLPRLELWYYFEDETPVGLTDQRLLRLSHAKATLHQQELRLPLPSQAVDLRIKRNATLTGNLHTMLEDKHIARFTAALQQSVLGRSGTLAGQPALTIKLPSWVANRSAVKSHQQYTHQDVKVEYVFERFEQIQKVAFQPAPEALKGTTDSRMKHVLDVIPASSYLEYTSIEGGLTGGNRAEFSLKFDTEAICTGSRDGLLDRQSTTAKNSQLVEAALALADAFTRINDGEVQPFTGNDVNRQDI